ncbi:hypothetical protein VE26_06340 [Devosia chinhatensis]|uniref:Major capsid protein n=2 Tax=Devosia chinhatensis TaxID=429727 RepID=A0A0F5FL10_9HYPH|nr:hypothetical protein VE26_06340 [Devosia chinhatensis]
MLREDALRGAISINLEMLETKEILMNPVNARVTAWLVPWLADPRFEGSEDQFNRSWAGRAKINGGATVPFFETHAMPAHGQDPIYKALGMHAPVGAQVNNWYRKAYNLIWNYRAANRSRHLDERLLDDTSLAPAFWQHSRFAHIVPDFDDAMFEGEVALNIVEQRLPISGIGVPTVAVGQSGPLQVRETMRGGDAQVTNYGIGMSTTTSSPNFFWMRGVSGPGGYFVPDIYAEMQQGGVTISLANLELAKKTQAFARLRQQFEGHDIDDEWLVDMLMSGLSIPDMALRHPIMIADRTVRFGQAKRYATDAGNLDESAVSGAARVNLNLRVPQLRTGGVVMVLVEILPDQLFERQADPFFMTNDERQGDTFKHLPDALRDTLDPQPVDIVLNKEIDTDHASPNGRFGYAPMNWKWNASGPKVGGKFLRPAANTSFDEARQRIWAVEQVNPGLTQDFYICRSIHTKPFLNEVGDPFEYTAMGNCVLNGLTQFGAGLIEATGNYDKVAEKAPVDRIQAE